MNDPLLMGVLDGMADLHEQVQPLLGREVVLVAVIGDLDAAHQFHDEVGPAGVGRSGVQHFGDVGMVHEGQGLPFGFEPGDDLFGVHPQLDDLEGHPAADGFFLLGHINDPAAALADFLQQLVAPDPSARFLDCGISRRQGCRLAQQIAYLRFQERIRALIGLKQGGKPAANASFPAQAWSR